METAAVDWTQHSPLTTRENEHCETPLRLLSSSTWLLTQMVQYALLNSGTGLRNVLRADNPRRKNNDGWKWDYTSNLLRKPIRWAAWLCERFDSSADRHPRKQRRRDEAFLPFKSNIHTIQYFFKWLIFKYKYLIYIHLTSPEKCRLGKNKVFVTNSSLQISSSYL